MHVKSVDGSDPDNLALINELSSESLVVLQLVDGSFAYATQLHINPWTTKWAEPQTGQRVSIPTSEVYEVRIQDHTTGMVDGLGLGMLAGASLGMLAGLSMRTSDMETPEAESSAAGAGVVGGALVGGIGMVIGSARGATQCYRFNNRYSQGELTERRLR